MTVHISRTPGLSSTCIVQGRSKESVTLYKRVDGNVEQWEITWAEWLQDADYKPIAQDEWIYHVPDAILNAALADFKV